MSWIYAAEKNLDFRFLGSNIFSTLSGGRPSLKTIARILIDWRIGLFILIAMSASKYPVSIKGVVFEAEKVWLRKNPRNEWELPGGRLENGEQPHETVVRELREELGIETKVKNLVDAGVLLVKVGDNETKPVFITSYLCEKIRKVGEPEFVGEDGSAEFKLFSEDQLDGINIPQVYYKAIKACFASLGEPT